MKISIENGNAFLASLGMEPAKKSGDFSDQISTKVDDRAAAERFADEWNAYHFETDSEERDHDALYTLKNRDPQVSMVTSAVFEWNYLAHICDFILGHKELFGKRILDAGCGNGILAVFLASVFPDSRITAVDRNPYVLRTADWLIKKAGIKNIELRQTDFFDIKGETFDTVFSSRTLADNDGDCPPMEWTDTTESLCRSSEIRSKAHADALAGLTAPGGSLVAAEMNGEWNIWGWTRVLCAHDLVPDGELCGSFSIEEFNSSGRFVSAVFKTGKSLGASEGDRIFREHLIPEGLWDSDVTHDRYGLIKLHLLKDKLYKGYAGFVTNPEEGLKNYRYFSFEMWTIKDDPKHMLFRQTAHYKGSIRVEVVDFEIANLVFNSALYDIHCLASDPHLTVYEISFENGEEKLTKVRRPRALFDPEGDIFIPDHSVLCRMAKEN